MFRSKSALVASLVAIVAIAAAGFFYLQYQDVKNDPIAEIEKQNLEETERVLAKLGTILKLETENEPTVARIDNPETLLQSNPEFYTDAQSGDYLVLYPSRAIVYREGINQVINVAPIVNTSLEDLTSDDDQPQNDETSEEPENPEQ